MFDRHRVFLKIRYEVNAGKQRREIPNITVLNYVAEIAMYRFCIFRAHSFFATFLFVSFANRDSHFDLNMHFLAHTFWMGRILELVYETMTECEKRKSKNGTCFLSFDAGKCQLTPKMNYHWVILKKQLTTHLFFEIQNFRAHFSPSFSLTFSLSNRRTIGLAGEIHNNFLVYYYYYYSPSRINDKCLSENSISENSFIR